MEESIRDFAKQFNFVPQLIGVPSTHKKIIVIGMGGSHLAADVLSAWKPEIDLSVHSGYSLPVDVAEAHIIASSFSGNTAETLSACQEAYTKGLPTSIITSGGALLEFAREKGIPHVVLPTVEGLQPRMALGFSLIALLKLIGDEDGIHDLGKLAYTLSPDKLEDMGRVLSVDMQGQIPVMYASGRNRIAALIWKIMLNETAKTPAFWNVFPELNHNEMEGFDGGSTTDQLRSYMRLVFMTDTEDDPRIMARMSTMEDILHKKEMHSSRFAMEGSSRIEKIFSTIIVGVWTALYLARLYKVEPNAVPLVEAFKAQLHE